MPPDDVLINKAAIIERCVRRMKEEARACPLLDQYDQLDMDVLRWVTESGYKD